MVLLIVAGQFFVLMSYTIRNHYHNIQIVGEIGLAVLSHGTALVATYVSLGLSKNHAIMVIVFIIIKTHSHACFSS